MRRLIGAAVAAASISFAGAAGAATTITFDDVASNPCCTFMQTYTSNDMIFRSVNGPLFFPPDVNPYGFTNIDPGGASILGSPLIMRVDGGGTFDLLGFTFGWRAEADHGETPATGWIDVRFVYDDGRDEIEQFDVHRFGPEALVSSRLALRRVEFQRGFIKADPLTCSWCTNFGGSIGSFVIDDAVVDNVGHSPDPPSPVPEPSTWAMIITGFGLAGATLRRRRPVRNEAQRLVRHPAAA